MVQFLSNLCIAFLLKRYVKRLRLLGYLSDLPSTSHLLIRNSNAIKSFGSIYRRSSSNFEVVVFDQIPTVVFDSIKPTKFRKALMCLLRWTSAIALSTYRRLISTMITTLCKDPHQNTIDYKRTTSNQ